MPALFHSVRQWSLACGMQEATGKALVAEAQLALKQFWEPDRLRKLCLSLLQHFLPLTVCPLTRSSMQCCTCMLLVHAPRVVQPTQHCL